MSDAERDAFLEEPELIRVACLDGDGDPYITVLWHEWRGGSFWLVARQRARWAQFMADDPRVSFVVDVQGSLRKVWGKGRAEVSEEPNVGGAWVQTTERMAVRYLGPDGPTYLTKSLAQPRWLIRVRPTQLETWQGAGWAKRYWVEETDGPGYEEAHGFTK
jgi:hypothetical protein